MLKSAFIIIIGQLLAGSLCALEPKAQVIDQPNAPIKIIEYKAKYQEGGKYSTKGIRHDATYRNTSDRQIVAVRLGLVSFDIWNEFLDRTGGVSIDDLAPGKDKSGAWVARAYGDFGFLTGVAYVSKVRFADGTIWSADLDSIAKSLGEIEEGFDVSRLKGRKKDG